MPSARARHIPSIERLRQSPRGRGLESAYGHAALVSALRAAADALRTALTADDIHAGSPSRADADVRTTLAGAPARPAMTAEAHTAASQADSNEDAPTDTRTSHDDLETHLLDRAEAQLAQRFMSRLRPVINATGVLIHTNLGRAPLAAEALARVQAVGAGYSALEYDLDTGTRGRRDLHAETLLRDLTGADAAIVVNNNAAAVLLLLTAIAAGREVIISRGELVEIGGGVRVPDVMRQSGAGLREVGTTNRTRVADYAAAISDRTALILRVHPSNFVIEGFTERPEASELAALGRRFNVPVAEDLGSGYVGGPAALDEPTVQQSVQAGIDIVTFSGDKLLGGPQAGIIAGARAPVDLMRKHPLMRALRVDKLTYAALEGTLIELARGRAHETVPVARMLSLTAEAVGARAAALALRLSDAGLRAAVTDGWSAVGGGSAPASRLPTRLVVLHPMLHEATAPGAGAAASEGRAADALLETLRRLPTPVIARIDMQRVVLDLRTVDPVDDDRLGRMLIAALSAR